MNRIEMKKIEFKSYMEFLSIAGFVLGVIAMPFQLMQLIRVEPSIWLLQVGLVIITPVFYAVAASLIALMTYLPFNMMLKFKGGMAFTYEAVEEGE